MNNRLFLIPILVGGFMAGPALAQSTPQEVDLFHQGIVSGCIYEFKKENSDVPQDVRDDICGCVDKWFKDNNINTVAYVNANKAIMPQVVGYCLKVVIGQ
jgi:hypothetical protein